MRASRSTFITMHKYDFHVQVYYAHPTAQPFMLTQPCLLWAAAAPRALLRLTHTRCPLTSLNPSRRFLRRVETGYQANPYHSSVHAADVLQTLSVLVTRSGLAPGYADPLTHMACLLAAVSGVLRINAFILQTICGIYLYVYNATLLPGWPAGSGKWLISNVGVALEVPKLPAAAMLFQRVWLAALLADNLVVTARSQQI